MVLWKDNKIGKPLVKLIKGESPQTNKVGVEKKKGGAPMKPRLLILQTHAFNKTGNPKNTVIRKVNFLLRLEETK